MSSPVRGAIVITTRNRENDLRRAMGFMASETNLTGISLIIVDDASNEVSPDYWRSESFPLPLAMLRNPRQTGYIGHRNIGYASAESEVVFSFDDDSVPVDREGLQRALNYMARHPRVGALSFPLVEGFGPFPPDTRRPFRCQAFVGCAHAVRRDLFVKLGGFRSDFIHQGEETEFCNRLWSAGYEVHAFPQCRVYHWATPTARSSARMGYYGPRNRTWTELLHTPTTMLPAQLARIALSYAKLSFRTRLPHVHFYGLLAGFANGIATWRTRRPLRAKLYRQLCALPSDGSVVSFVEKPGD